MIEKQGTSGSALTDIASLSFSDVVSLWQSLGVARLEDVLQQAAVTLCCDVLSQDIGKGPLLLKKREKGGATRLVEPGEHALADLLADRPNFRHTWTEFKEMSVFWYALMTNAYIWVDRSRTGEIRGLFPVATPRVETKVLPRQRRIYYHVKASTLQELALYGWTSRDVAERDMVHVRGRMLDAQQGYSTLRVGRQTFDTGAAIEDYRDSLFSEDGQIRGIFQRDAEGALDERAYQRLVEGLRQRMRRFNRGDPLVLEDKLQFKPIAVNPQEAELTKQFEAQVTATARLFNVPPHRLFQLNAVKYENLEPMQRAYVGDTLVPICTRFEDRMNVTLLTREERLAGYHFYFDRDAMSVNDPKALAERMQKLVERGVISRNEARMRVGYNPVDGGDTFMIPANMQLVDEDNNPVLEAGDPAGQQPADDQQNDGGLKLAVDNT